MGGAGSSIFDDDPETEISELLLLSCRNAGKTCVMMREEAWRALLTLSGEVKQGSCFSVSPKLLLTDLLSFLLLSTCSLREKKKTSR